MQKDFLNKNIFKANDIRGVYPSEINEEVVFKIILGVKNILKKSVVVGCDARLSSPRLYGVVLAALKQDKKIKIIEAGLVTTPAFYFLVNKYGADGGIMVTASHNPKQYNGLKIVGKRAVPISGQEIFNLLSNNGLQKTNPPPQSKSVVYTNKFPSCLHSPGLSGETSRSKIFLKEYIYFLKKHFKVSRKLKIVFDCSSGVAGLVMQELFSSLLSLSSSGEQSETRGTRGLDSRFYGNDRGMIGNKKINPIFINAKPDGNFLAHSPNPLVSGSLDQIKKEVLKQKADLGVIFDGDGDRVFFIDNLGREIDPDIIGSILIKKYKPPFVVSTISSWRIKKVRGAVVASVGHLFMKEMMREKKASLGMERSGHYYFKKFFYCDSGALAALEIIKFVSKLKNTFSDYIDLLPKYYQTQEANFDLSSGGKTRKNLEKKIIKIENFYKPLAKKINKKDGLLVEAGDWWFSLRFSNSENLFRLNIEANDKKTLDKRQKELRALILG